jgi:hypothetical protein
MTGKTQWGILGDVYVNREMRGLQRIAESDWVGKQGNDLDARNILANSIAPLCRLGAIHELIHPYPSILIPDF